MTNDTAQHFKDVAEQYQAEKAAGTPPHLIVPKPRGRPNKYGGDTVLKQKEWQAKKKLEAQNPVIASTPLHVVLMAFKRNYLEMEADGTDNAYKLTRMLDELQRRVDGLTSITRAGK